MPLIPKARTVTGRIVQAIGIIIYLGCGLAMAILIFGIIADALGTWVAVLAFIFFPVLFTIAPLIHWLITGTCPLLIFILWAVGLFVGGPIFYLGSRIKGDIEGEE